MLGNVFVAILRHNYPHREIMLRHDTARLGLSFYARSTTLLLLATVEFRYVEEETLNRVSLILIIAFKTSLYE
jgi:hypothetical protein